jgi:fatty acid desaturase
MHHHVEHHMYAAVPCYNLAALRLAIAARLVPPKGLLGAWREIAHCVEMQANDSAWELKYDLPT